jgi:hypothetical protein
MDKENLEGNEISLCKSGNLETFPLQIRSHSRSQDDEELIDIAAEQLAAILIEYCESKRGRRGRKGELGR